MVIRLVMKSVCDNECFFSPLVFRFGGGDPGVLKAMVDGGHLGLLLCFLQELFHFFKEGTIYIKVLLYFLVFL